jgi:hypothetical protein
MHSTVHSPAPHPLGTRVLHAVALATVVLGGAVLVLTAVGVGHADVRGLRLTGALRLGFLGGLALAVAGAAVAAAGLARGRRWGAGLLAVVWPSFALVCLALDRATPAPGPGRPLAFYVVAIGLLPGCRHPGAGAPRAPARRAPFRLTNRRT